MGISLIVEWNSGTGEAEAEAATLVACFDTSKREYDGKGPSKEEKSLVALTSKIDNIGLSTVNSHSR
jgi:hypothetical protein